MTRKRIHYSIGSLGDVVWGRVNKDIHHRLQHPADSILPDNANPNSILSIQTNLCTNSHRHFHQTTKSSLHQHSFPYRTLLRLLKQITQPPPPSPRTFTLDFPSPFINAIRRTYFDQPTQYTRTHWTEWRQRFVFELRVETGDPKVRVRYSW